MKRGKNKRLRIRLNADALGEVLTLERLHPMIGARVPKAHIRAYINGAIASMRRGELGLVVAHAGRRKFERARKFDARQAFKAS